MSLLKPRQSSGRKHELRNGRSTRPLVIEPLEARQLLSATLARLTIPAFNAPSPLQSAAEVPTLQATAARSVFGQSLLSLPPQTAIPTVLPLVQNPSVQNSAPLQILTTPAVTEPQSQGLLAEETAASAADPILEDASLPVPALSSNPGAEAKIYLDFDGHFESVWGAYRNITTPVFSLDSDLTTFSSTELAAINSIWARVAEDYAPFNVDITTVEPASFENLEGLRVSIGGNGSWYGSAGGLAYVGTWTNSIVNTVYVFPQQLASNEKYIAEASSHEAGHAFALYHQSRYDTSGAKTEEYHTGSGDWAPIMGNSYYKTRTTWHNGTSTSATTYQDDMAILSSANNAFGYRADDHGNIDDPTALTLVDNIATAGGIIGYMDDEDAFLFSTSGGDYSITQDVAAIGANLDSTLQLRTADGTLVASSSPSTSYGAAITATLAAGHYVLISGSAGQYGSVGQYTVTVEQLLPPTLTPDPAASSISEAAGMAAATGTVTRNSADLSTALVVTLSNSDPSEIAVPATVTIPIGQSSATFSIDAIDDAVVDGTQTVEITATASGYSAVVYSISVTDDDVLTLSLAIDPASVSEGAGAGAATAVVTRNDGNTASELVVTLTCSDTSEISIPVSMTIPAGQASATFSIDAVDDFADDATQTVTLTATATNYVSAGATIGVIDDDDIIEIEIGAEQIVVINGQAVSYDLTTFPEIQIQCGSGRDRIAITGVGNGETAELVQDRVDVSGLNYAIHVAGVENITVEALEGSTARATLVGSDGSNRLYSYPDRAVLTDSVRSFDHRVARFATVTASSWLGSRDCAFLYDSPNDDFLTSAAGQVAFNRADGWCDSTAIGFSRVYIHATSGGKDTAELAGPGTDANRFYSYPTYSILTDSRSSFYYYASGFETLTATAAGVGSEYAYFYDSEGDDRFTASPTQAAMVRPEPWLTTTAFGFQRVYAYSTRGGTDTAVLTGSDLGNRFRAYPAYGTLTDLAGSFYHYVKGFQQVTALGSQTNASGDIAYLYDSTTADLFVGRSYWGELADQAGTTFRNRVEYFDVVYARSSDDSAVDDTIQVDASLLYRLARWGTW